MMRGRTADGIAAASLAILALGVSGCDGGASSASKQQTSGYTYRPKNTPREELSREQIAALLLPKLLERQDASCPLAVAEAGSIHTADQAVYQQAETLDGWFDRTVRANRQKYPLSEVHHDGPGWGGTGWKSLEETYEYKEAGRDMRLKTNKTWGTSQARDLEGYLGDYPYKHVQVFFCAFVPDHVEILSTSGSSTSGWIGAQYQLAWTPTAILRTFISADLRGLHLPEQPRTSGSATLQRTGAGTWDAQLQ